MGGSYAKSLAARAILVYCAATAAGVLTGIYFMPSRVVGGQSDDDLGNKMWGSSHDITQSDSTTRCSQPFILSIIVELKPEVRQEWLQQWAKLAQYILDHEPSLISYELLEVEAKHNTFIVYERYCKKSDLHDIHQQSKPFNEFKGWCAKTDPYVIKDGQGAYPTGLGHWTRV